MENDDINLKILTVNETQCVVVLLFDGITEANKRYEIYKENLTIRISGEHNGRFAVEFKFVDTDLIPRQFLLNEAEMVATGLGLLNDNVANSWSCGYEVGLEPIPIYPLKPLEVVRW